MADMREEWRTRTEREETKEMDWIREWKRERKERKIRRMKEEKKNNRK